MVKNCVFVRNQAVVPLVHKRRTALDVLYEAFYNCLISAGIHEPEKVDCSHGGLTETPRALRDDTFRQSR